MVRLSSSSSSSGVPSSSSKWNGELMRASEGPSREMGLRMGGDPSANEGPGGAADRVRDEGTATWDPGATVGSVGDTVDVSAPLYGDSGAPCVFVDAAVGVVAVSRMLVFR